MRSLSLFLAASIATLATSTPTLVERQTSATIARTPEGTPNQLEDTVDAICQPSLYTWKRGSLNEKKAAGLDRYESITEVELSFKDSPFPCERISYLRASCLKSTTISRDSSNVPYDSKEKEEEQGTGSPAQIKAERDCYCHRETWNLREGCAKCGAVHGYGMDSTYIDLKRKMAGWVLGRFCNETMPGKNYYFIVNSGEYDDALEQFRGDADASRQAAQPDLVGGKTDVSYYYTPSASRAAAASGTGTGSEAKASATSTAASTADGDVTEIRGTATSIGGGATATVSQGRDASAATVAASSAAATVAGSGANEAKARGGFMIAVLGALALL